MNKKNLELNLAIGLAVLLLIVVLVVFMKADKTKLPSSAEKISQKKEKPHFTAPSSPRTDFMTTPIEESRKPTFSEKTHLPAEDYEDEKEPHVMMLKDLPLDSIAAKQEAPEEETVEETTSQGVRKRTLKTQPSPDDLKAIQQKNLIIY
jgi:hypothetical protein